VVRNGFCDKKSFLTDFLELFERGQQRSQIKVIQFIQSVWNSKKLLMHTLIRGFQGHYLAVGKEGNRCIVLIINRLQMGNYFLQ